MSGSNAKVAPEINLDEFERRLRSAGAPPAAVEDPLAELTRLVDMISRDNERGEGPAQPSSRLPNTQAAPPLAAAPPLPPPPVAPPAPPIEFDAGEFDATESFGLTEEERAGLLAAAAESQARAPGGRGWYFKTVGLAAVGVALLGGAAALKFGAVPGLPKKPPFIAAAEGPAKVQPPSDATVQSGGDAGALLMKDSTSSAPVKVVSTEEQPIDLRTQTSGAPPSAAASASPSPASPVAPSADTPVIPPSDSTATVAPLFPEAKPVKTVSVRPDGTLISTDAAASTSPAPTPPPKAVNRVADNANGPASAESEPATPKVDLPTKLSPKSTARVAKTDTTAPASATDTTPNTPLQLGSASAPTRSVKPPAAATSQVADDAPAAQAPASESSGGGWAVQFAAPRSEADAQSAITRLKSKYADALGATELNVRKADVKGETIYRVRSGGLSKADAAALCSKLKASGGDCFIARN